MDIYEYQHTAHGTDHSIVSYDLHGIFDREVGLVKDEDSKVLSKIILYLIIPCVIINAFQVDYTMDTAKGLLLALAASVMTQVLLLIIISIAGKLLHLNEVEIASVYYSNSGNLIVPIVTFILGQDWVLYGCVFMSVQLIFLWTHCKKIISRESSYDWKKIVLNINMISIFIGVVLFFRQNPFAGDHQQYSSLSGQHDRTGQYGRNRYAVCRNESETDFC